MDSISTGCPDFDQLFQGYPVTALSLIYGRGGSGKTTLCLLASAAQLREGKKVIFLDARRNFTFERLQQLYPDAEKSLERMLVLTLKNFNVQHQQVKELEQVKKVGLIVVDAMTTYYRRLYAQEPDLAKAMLGKQLAILKKIALSQKIPIILTSEVYADLKGNTRPVAHDVLGRFCEKVVKLEREPRRLLVEKPEKAACRFVIETAHVRRI